MYLYTYSTDECLRLRLVVIAVVQVEIVVAKAEFAFAVMIRNTSGLRKRNVYYLSIRLFEAFVENLSDTISTRNLGFDFQ